MNENELIYKMFLKVFHKFLSGLNSMDKKCFHILNDDFNPVIWSQIHDVYFNTKNIFYLHKCRAFQILWRNFLEYFIVLCEMWEHCKCSGSSKLFSQLHTCTTITYQNIGHQIVWIEVTDIPNIVPTLSYIIYTSIVSML